MRKNQQQVCQMMAHERMPYVAPQSTVITVENNVLHVKHSDAAGGAGEWGHNDNPDCDPELDDECPTGGAKGYVFDDNAFAGPKWDNEFED